MPATALQPLKDWAFAPLSGSNGMDVAVAIRTLRAAGPQPVELRRQAGTRTYLGALVDVNGQPHSWLEIWVQSTCDILSSYTTRLRSLTSVLVDQRWNRMVAGFRLARPGTIVGGPWEQEDQALPVFLDLQGMRCGLPAAPNGMPWRLCRDDAVLRSAGLPTYSESLIRHLYDGEGAAAGSFLRATPATFGDEGAAQTQPIGVEDLFTGLTPINPEGGRMMVRHLSPLALEDMIDLVSGRQLEGQGRLALELPALPGSHALALSQVTVLGGNAWFLSHAGKPGRILEAFYLKLALFLGMARVVSESVASAQAPFLNLDPGSFTVALGQVGPALPALWSFDVQMAGTPEPLMASLAAGDQIFFIPAEDARQSTYRSSDTAQIISATAREARIFRISPPDDEGRVQIEGTLETAEPVDVRRRDLLVLHLRLDHRTRLTLHGFFDENASEPGSYRFISVRQPLPPAFARHNLENGIIVGRPNFELIPLLGTPADLHSLGTLGVRLFLTNEHHPLALACDELKKLCSLSRKEPAQSFLHLASLDERWRADLGQHRVLHADTSPDLAAAAIPEELWWETLKVIASCFPGATPSSYCRDTGDFLPHALHEVFAPLLADLNKLTAITRSMLTGDLAMNWEVLQELRQFTR